MGAKVLFNKLAGEGEAMYIWKNDCFRQGYYIVVIDEIDLRLVSGIQALAATLWWPVATIELIFT